MDLTNICFRLKAKIPQVTNRFSIQRPITTVEIDNGLVRINSPLVHGHTGTFDDDIVTISGNQITYEDVGLAPEFVNYAHKVNANLEYDIKQKYISGILVGGTLHTDIRVHISPSKESALEHFKVTPKDTIYLIENQSKYKVGDSWNSTDTDNLLINRFFTIQIYLYNKDDRLQQDNIGLSKILERYILTELRGFEFESVFDTISNCVPISAHFAMVTRQTTVFEMEFKLIETLHCGTTDDFSFRLAFENLELTDEKMQDRDIKHSVDTERLKIVPNNSSPYVDDDDGNYDGG